MVAGLSEFIHAATVSQLTQRIASARDPEFLGRRQDLFRIAIGKILECAAPPIGDVPLKARTIVVERGKNACCRNR